MPDHLVEKAARALSAKWNSRGGRCIYPANSKPEDWIDSGDAQAVLSALSGDLVPREEAAAFLGDERHPDWSDYVATNLLAALQRVPDTGDWHGALRSWCERNTTGNTQPNAAPNLVPRSQADALAEALERPIRSIEMLLESDTTLPRDLRFDLTEAMNEGRSRLASYRKTTGE